MLRIIIFIFLIGSLRCRNFIVRVDSFVLKDVITSEPYYVNIAKGNLFISLLKEGKVLYFDYNGNSIGKIPCANHVSGNQKNFFFPFYVFELGEKHWGIASVNNIFIADSFHILGSVDFMGRGWKSLFHMPSAIKGNIKMSDTHYVLPVLYKKEKKYINRLTNKHRLLWKYLKIYSLTPDVIGREVDYKYDFYYWDVYSYSEQFGRTLLWLDLWVDTLSHEDRIFVAPLYSPFVYVYTYDGKLVKVFNTCKNCNNNIIPYNCKYIKNRAFILRELKMLLNEYIGIFVDEEYIYRIVYPSVKYEPLETDLYKISYKKACNKISDATLLREKEYKNKKRVCIDVYDKHDFSYTRKIDLSRILNSYVKYAGFDLKNRIVFFYREDFHNDKVNLVIYKVYI